MGHKSKNGAKQGGGEAAPEPEILLTTTAPFNPKDAGDPLELLDMCVAALHDKRGATREAAMAALVGALEAVAPVEELDSRCLAIFALCGVSIKKGTALAHAPSASAAAASAAREARLACRAVGLLALTLRAGSSGILAESFPAFARTLQFHALHDTATVLAALHSLAAVTFAGSLGAEEADRSLKAIWEVVWPPSSRSPSKLTVGARKTTSPVVVAAAVSAWTFLLTTVNVTDARRKAERDAWNAAVASLAGLLEAGDRAVRMAAGTALALCVELNLTQYTPRKDMEAVAARVADLAIEAGGKGVDKTLFLEQKGLFKQIAAFLNHGERPCKSVRLQASSGRLALRVSTWVKLVQLEFLRSFLGGGFLNHVQGNKLFAEAFAMGADERKTLSIAAKKQDSKANQKKLKVKRDMAWEMKNVFFLPQRAAPQERWTEQLLQLGWH
ncbi:hypothetical protein ACP70R_028680 [Stipagrostis hirtigluma subsp. patula]